MRETHETCGTRHATQAHNSTTTDRRMRYSINTNTNNSYNNNNNAHPIEEREAHEAHRTHATLRINKHKLTEENLTFTPNTPHLHVT